MISFLPLSPSKASEISRLQHCHLIAFPLALNSLEIILNMIEPKTDNQTALWNAVYERNLAAVDLLLRSGADALAVDHKGVTPLYYAILRNNTSITRIMLEHLATFFSTATFLDKNVNSVALPLYLSAQLGRTNMIELLLEFGADVNVYYHEQTPLHEAVYQGHSRHVELLLGQQDIDLQSRNDNGSTALHVAVKKNHFSIVDLLLAHPQIDINCRDNHGNTPLWWSTWLEHDRISSRLIAMKGVDLNAVGQKSGLVTTALYHTVERAKYSVAEQLVRHSELNPNILGSLGWTPLGHAARDGNLEMVKLLLTRQDICLNALGPGEDSPLWLATKCGRTQVVKLLLQQGNRLNINSQTNKKNETALSAAAYSGDLSIVRLILKDTRTDLNTVNKAGKTAIWLAASKGHSAVVVELLRDPRIYCDPKYPVIAGNR
jgi:ankyrin repeat protein